MKEQTQCYATCKIEHNCLGGYLGKEHACDDEFARIGDELRATGQYEKVIFAPSSQHNRTQFICTNRSGVVIIPIADGYIEYPD